MSTPEITWPGHRQGQTSSPAAPIVAPQNEAKVLRAFGDEMHVHVGGAETGGKYAILTDVTPPGSGPPPHYRENEDEWFYPVEGRVEFFLDGAWQEVPLHTLIFIPRGVVHTFRNCGDTPLKMLTQTAPAGFEIFFERCAEVFAEPGPPDMARILEISAEHGIYYVEE